MTNDRIAPLFETARLQQFLDERASVPRGFFQNFEGLPLGPLVAPPRLGRWFCVQGTPQVVLNTFKPIPGIPSDYRQGLMFPTGCEFVMLSDFPFTSGVLRMVCVRPVPITEIPPTPKPSDDDDDKETKKDPQKDPKQRHFIVRFTAENQLNEVLASVRYGLSGFVEVSSDGYAYRNSGVRWTPNASNFFSITVDLPGRSWRLYFKNAQLEELLSEPMPLGEAQLRAVSHMRVLNGRRVPSYSLEMGIGRANLENHFGLRFDPPPHDERVEATAH